MLMSDAPTARILIVDDEAAQMKALCDTLTDRGYATVGFTTGTAALAALREAGFDLLLADLMMPEMDGITLLRAALATDPNLVGIIMTGEGTIATAVEAMKTGALDYILKPFKLSVILPVLARALAVRRLRMDNAALEQRIREHTTQLAAANRAMEHANSAKDRFLASMSHELRTPLNAIIGFTGTLLMGMPGPLTTVQEKQLRIVQGSAQHLLSLINDILDFAKIESGDIAIQRAPLICQHVIAEVVSILRPLAEAKGLQLEIQVPPVDLVMQSDRRALSQVLINLINNAIKFTEIGVVRLELRRRQENGRMLAEIRVVDTGIGIHPEDQTKLFQAFTQVDAATTRQHEGTGLGLHLSQKLAQLLGGQITVESEYGVGSTFIVGLPAE
jgi:signal transduction histidine kinase